MTINPDKRLWLLAGRLEASAKLAAVAKDHIRDELRNLNGHAGWPEQTMGDGTPASHGVRSIVESQVCTADDLRATLAQIDDDTTTFDKMISDFTAMLNRIQGVRLPKVDGPKLCDGRPFEGSRLPWVRYSHDPNNGWHDPTCREAADSSGLCPACRIRCTRYRREHDLPPLNTTQEGIDEEATVNV